MATVIFNLLDVPRSVYVRKSDGFSRSYALEELYVGSDRRLWAKEVGSKADPTSTSSEVMDIVQTRMKRKDGSETDPYVVLADGSKVYIKGVYTPKK